MKKKKKTLLYIGNKLAKKGGTTSVIDSLSEQLENEGYSVVTSSDKKNKAHRLLDMITTFAKVKNDIDAVLIDTYSTKNFYYAIVIGKLCRKYNIPYFPILHGGNLPDRLERSPKKSRKYFGGAQVNISPSLFLKEAFEAKNFTNCIYIPNAIKLEDYPFKLRSSVQLNLLWVRSFSEIYKPLLTIKVLEKLIERGYKATLCMVGPEKDGNLSACRVLATKKELPVTFTGLLTKKEWVSQSIEYDLFINTTDFDNLPVSIIEAMALGFPIVSTNVGGLPFLISDGKDGILVPPDDVDAMVEAIEKIYNTAHISEAMSKAARLKGESYNWEVIKESWHKVLDF